VGVPLKWPGLFGVTPVMSASILESSSKLARVTRANVRVGRCTSTLVSSHVCRLKSSELRRLHTPWRHFLSHSPDGHAAVSYCLSSTYLLVPHHIRC
jgi:hypothetical protein